jgi:hypothetical protein
LLVLDAGIDQIRQLRLEVWNPFEVRADELYGFGSVGNFALEDLDLAGRPTPMLHLAGLLQVLAPRLLLRTQLPHTHSLDHDILLVLLGSAPRIHIGEFNPQIVHFLRKRGLFVQHVCDECQLIVPRAVRRILREMRIQLERLRREAS